MISNQGEAFICRGGIYLPVPKSIDRTVFGEQHPNVARELNNLGSAYFDLGQRDTAKGYFEKAHAIFKKFFGDHHPHTKIAAEGLEDCQEAVRE